METTATLRVVLQSVEDTLCFGKRLGTALRLAFENGEPLRSILLFGDLGSGKTTLTRGLILGLPNGDQAEVSSPSFTICNEYPTTPRVIHCDVYREDENALCLLPEEAEEALDRHDGSCVVVEWAQRLPATALPDEHLDIHLISCQEHHFAVVNPHGNTALCVFQQLARDDTAKPPFEE